MSSKVPIIALLALAAISAYWMTRGKPHESPSDFGRSDRSAGQAPASAPVRDEAVGAMSAAAFKDVESRASVGADSAASSPTSRRAEPTHLMINIVRGFTDITGATSDEVFQLLDTDDKWNTFESLVAPVLGQLSGIESSICTEGSRVSVRLIKDGKYETFDGDSPRLRPYGDEIVLLHTQKDPLKGKITRIYPGDDPETDRLIVLKRESVGRAKEAFAQMLTDMRSW